MQERRFLRSCAIGCVRPGRKRAQNWPTWDYLGPGAGGLFGVIFGVIFGVLFWLLFGPLLAPKMAPKTDPKPLQNSTFLRSIFEPLFLKVLELSRDLSGAFLGLLRLSWEASGPKNL